jgi:hypothetical protein
MKLVMKNITVIFGGILAFILIALIAVFIFTAPSWYIWNHIIVPKFDAPTFSFWETFFTILMIRFIIPTSSINKGE